NLSEVFDLRRCLVCGHQLVRIGTAVVAHCNSFAPPDQLCAAFAEMLPATNGEFIWPAIFRSIPTFHRENTEPVPNREIVELIALRERRTGAGFELPIEFQIDAMLTQIARKFSFGFQGCDTTVI